MDRNLGNESLATDGFQEAIGLLESLTLNSEATGLEQRVSLYPLSYYFIILYVKCHIYVVAEKK